MRWARYGRSAVAMAIVGMWLTWCIASLFRPNTVIPSSVQWSFSLLAGSMFGRGLIEGFRLGKVGVNYDSADAKGGVSTGGGTVVPPGRGNGGGFGPSGGFGNGGSFGPSGMR